MTRVRAYLVLLVLAPGHLLAQHIISTLAGTDWVFLDNGKLAVNASIGHIGGIATDSLNNIYIADNNNSLILRVNSSGILTVVAGNGIAGFSGDGGPATEASVNHPLAVAVDPAGNIFIADYDNRRIRKVDAKGIITTFAGNGVPYDPNNPGFGQAENIPATQASVAPIGLFIDAKGYVYVGDGDHNKVREIGLSGLITTVAGNGSITFNGDNQPATSASLNFPRAMALDASGNLYIADSFHFRIRKVDANHMISTVMGSSQEATSKSPDGTLAANAQLNLPYAITIDNDGNIYVGDVGNQVVQVILALTGTVVTVAGTGASGFSGDGAPPTNAMLSGPGSLAFDQNWSLLIGDQQNSRVRRIANGAINTISGNGLYKSFVNGGPALQAYLTAPEGLSFDLAGNLYIADTLNNRIERLTPDGNLTIVAGTGDFDYYGDGGPATAAALGIPRDVVVDAVGNIYIADAHNTRVREVTLDGNIRSIACGQILVACGPLVDPSGLAIAADGSVFIADGAGNAIRQVRPDLTVTTVAGTGSPTCGGDGGPAAQACVNDAQGVTLDTEGNVYISDTGNNVIRKVTTDGVINTIVGNGQSGYAGDGGSALQASLNGPTKIAVGSDGSLYIADAGNNVVRMVTPSGIITTLAGTGKAGFGGDGGVATSSLLNGPVGVAVDVRGYVYISDTLNNRIRVVSGSVPLFANPAISLPSTGLSFHATVGDAPPAPQNLSIRLTTDGMNSALPFSISASAPWVLITPSLMGNTPSTVQVSADPRQISQAGSYAATITIFAPGFPGVTPVKVPVAFTVTASSGGGGALSINPPAISLELTQQTPTASFFIQASITVQGTGITSLPLTVATSGEPWLLVISPASSVQPGLPANISLQVNLRGLPPGAYRSVVTVTSLPSQVYKIPVTVVLVGSQASLALSRDSIAFTAVAGGATVPPPQTFSVLNKGSGMLNWNLAPCASIATCANGGGPGWLILPQTSGVSGASATSVPVLVNPAGLTPGRYSALVQVSAANTTNSPRFVSVLLNVVTAASDPGPAVTPSTLVFTANGTTAPGSQSIGIYNLGTQPRNFNAFYGTLDGGNWLTVIIPKPPLNPAQPFQATVQTDPSQLGPGLYRAAITFLFDTGDIRNTLITLVVAASPKTVIPGSLGARVLTSGCVPSQSVQPAITTLGTGTQMPAGVPAAIDALVMDPDGCPLTTGTVTAQVADSTGAVNSVALNNLGGGMWEGLWQAAAAGTVNVTVSASDPNLPVSGVSDPAVQANVGPPLDGTLAVSSVASTTNQMSGPVAPGSLITVFGLNLGPRVPPPTAAPPWTTTLGGVTARLGGVLLPISFVSQNTLNTMVPFDVQSGTTPQLIVAYTDATGASNLSVLPVAVSLTDTQPAINSQNNTGKGLGLISNANGLISSGNPAHAGDSITISCTGLGAVTPSIDAGLPVPAYPSYSVEQPVMVSIGGNPPIPALGSLTPGAPGQYTVTIVVPPLSPGTYDLTVTVGSATSPPVQIVIQ